MTLLRTLSSASSSSSAVGQIVGNDLLEILSDVELAGGVSSAASQKFALPSTRHVLASIPDQCNRAGQASGVTVRFCAAPVLTRFAGASLIPFHTTALSLGKVVRRFLRATDRAGNSRHSVEAMVCLPSGGMQ